MSPCLTWCCACMVAVIFCASPELSHSHECSTEETKNATVDLNLALSRGIRGADPVHVASWEACVNTCCLEQRIAGNKKCNLVVFKAQKKGSSLNCYMFHCPTEGACALKQAVGLVTYRIKKDVEVPKPTSSPSKSPDLIAIRSTASLKAAVIGPATSPNWLSPSPKLPASKTRKILLGRIEKPVDKSHRHSHPLEVEGANRSASLDSRPTRPTISSMNPTSTPQSLVPTIKSTVKLPTVTPSNQTSSVTTVPPHKVASTKHATAVYGNTHVTTVSPRRSSSAPQLTATSDVKASSLNPQPSSLSKKISSAVLHKAQLSHGQLSRDSDMLTRASSERHPFSLSDRSVLVAVLLCGVIFLLLAQVVIGRKLLESLRHRQYSRLDYLINGIYANV